MLQSDVTPASSLNGKTSTLKDANNFFALEPGETGHTVIC